ncbi:23S rRNA (pseudouridine(1915)-N(3))-methyltransferase RlmH [Pseudoalteromonas sp. MEBiC 03485]|uniref:23S rRNA (pseudouridine(1915)-N(3))-methyltransferase RlmH n=1 Tax=Pseudoalteromonas sp. MEBiC 03485 TaxID=2571103 RepID=UPI0010A2F00D|nr:23S rRNA (pseudouridine(1915)-N(3))-methyltransferase RlmH [Pseudoalteromonas sp. MEBiC 03485]
MQCEAMLAARTDGTYMIRLEDENGVKEVQLTPEQFAQFITGKLVIGKSVE